jgi:hypothetical protein
MVSTVAIGSMCRSFSLSVAWTTVAALGVLKVRRMTKAARPPIGRLI